MKSSLNIMRSIKIIVTITILCTTTTHLLPMWEWIKAKMGYNTIRQNQDKPESAETKNPSIITIKEVNNVGHLSFTITNVAYNNMIETNRAQQATFVPRSAYVSTRKYANISIDIDMCQQIATVIGKESLSQEEIFKFTPKEDDFWFLRAVFFAIQAALINYEIDNQKCSVNKLLEIELKPNDPGYKVALNAYYSLVKKFNKERRLQEIQLSLVDRPWTTSEKKLLGFGLGAPIALGIIGVLYGSGAHAAMRH